MKITPLDIRQMRFGTQFRGYPPKEVDFFLERLAEEVEEILKENLNLRDKIEEQEEVIFELRKKEGALTHTLVAVQKTIDDMKAAAQKEGELIIRQAELRGEEIAQAATHRVTQLQAEEVSLRRQRDLLIVKIRSLIQSFEKTLEWESEEGKEAS